MAINSLSASSYGLSGLVSGMDTQQMVEKMLSGTQSKIDKAMQKKTQLQYKQTAYRDVITKLKTLQESYLSFTSGTNLLSSSFYNTMNASIKLASGITSAAFSVTASTDAKVGNTTVDYIKQLATAQTKKTTKDATGKVAGEMNQDVAARLVSQYTGADAALTIKVGGQNVTIDDAALTFGGKTQSEIAQIINGKFAAAGMGDVAEAKFVNNKLQIVAADEEAYITVSGPSNAADKSLAMKMFGSGTTSLSGKGTLSATINSDLYQPSFEVNLDGRQQTIYMDLAKLKNFAETGNIEANLKDAADQEIPNSSLLGDIQAKLLNAFGAGVQAGVNASGQLEFKSGNTTQKFTITGNATTMGMFGLKTGVSNKLNTNMAIRELNFSNALQGNHHTFTINGVEFSYDSSASLSGIIADVNASKAGVKISYLESEDRFVIQSSETGDGTRDIEIAQTEGNLMTALFGVDGGATATGYGVQMDMVGTAVSDSDIANGGVFTFNINGKDYKFTANRSEYDAYYTTETLAKRLNTAFAENFGTMPDGTQNVEITEKDGVFTIRANSSDYVVKAAKYNEDTNTHQLGFTETQSTVVNSGATTLTQAGIKFGNGADIILKMGSLGTLTFGANELDGKSMDEVAAHINNYINTFVTGTTERPSVSFDAKTGAFKFTGVTGTGAGGTNEEMSISVKAGGESENVERLFGQMSLTANVAGGGAGYLETTDEGRNAIFSINGNEMQRASNTFTVDGLTFTLQTTTHTNQAAAGNPSHADYEDYRGQSAQVNVSRDTEKIVEGLSEFLKLYNETVDFINDLYKADATYKDYAPLTDAQKETMSDREIELWEEKAKEGLLRNDQNLERILSAMRSVMYTKPEDSSIAIYDLGITTSYYTSDGNLNPKSLADMQAAIEKDPEAVAKLFAGEGGIMELLNNAINDATKSSYAGSGYLTGVAGSNALDTSSSISKQITAIDEQLVTLENRYWKEYDRYWTQFNKMEQLIQQMNTQSSWLSQMSG